MSSETIDSTMNQDATTALVPKLRFPEFRGEEGWKEKPLKAAAEINPANGGLPESFVYIDLESVDAGELKAKGRISLVGAPSRAQRLVERGDIIYQVVRPYQRNNLLCEFDHDENYVASTGYAQLRANGNNRFLYQSIHTDSFVGRVIAKCTGSNYPAINSSDLAEIHLPIPPTLPEQQKIADCLSSLDELIAAQARKVEALKTHKKALMQQLFPREGETQPRLRFPEFQDAGDWKPQRLSGQIVLISGMHLSPNDYSTAGEVPYFTGPSDFANDLSKVTKWTKRTANVSQAGDTLITVKGSGVGEIWYSALPEVAMGRQLMAVRSKNGSSHFMFQFLLTKRSRFEDLGSGNLIPGLSRADILELDACFPKPVEQQRIATCLSSLDALITAEIQKLEAFKTHKKGLMQQLFPSAEEVET